MRCTSKLNSPVYDGTSEREFTLTSGANTASGTFEGYVTEGADDIEALFPSNAGSWNGSSFDFDIPDIQDATTQSIDSKALIMTASGSVSTGLSFENAPALLRFSVGDGATRVIFHTLNGEKIAGNETSVIITVSGEGTYEAAINPISYAGIRAFVTNGSGTFLKEGVSTINLGAGEGLNMGTISSSTEVVAIATPAELQAFLGGTPALDAYLCKDLDLTAVNPGTLASYSDDFDGQGHILKNWTANAALFGTLSGSISNLTIGDSCTMGNPSSGNFGYLVNELTGSMVSCINEADINVTFADVTSQYIFGSLVGCSNAASAVMTDCVNNGDIDVAFTVPTDVQMAQPYIGGLVGKVGTASSVVRMDGCVNDADHLAVNISSGVAKMFNNVYIGGIAGAAGLSEGDAAGYTSNHGIFDGCENNAAVDVEYGGGTGGSLKIGGIIGAAECALKDCVNNGAVSFTGGEGTCSYPTVGGIAGNLFGPANPNAQNCSNYGAVSFSAQIGNGTQAIMYYPGNGGTYYCYAGGCFGVVGADSNAIDNCDNYGALSFTPRGIITNGSSFLMGGVAGRSMAAMSGCDNLSTSTQIMSSNEINTLYIGGVVGASWGTNCTSVSNCHNSATINTSRDNLPSGTTTLETYFGGVIGYNRATTVSNCTNSGDVSCVAGAKGIATTYAAGVLGYSYGAVDLNSCGNTGAFAANGKYNAGVFAYARAASTLTSCSNTGTVSYDGDGQTTLNVWVSGVFGYAGGTISLTGCTNEGAINAEDWSCASANYVAGIYGGGYSSDTKAITDCTNTGSITVDSGSMLHVGGIAGAMRGAIKGIVQNANITVSGSGLCKVGGLMGYYYAGTVQQSTNRGNSISGNVTTTITPLADNDNGIDDENGCTGGIVGMIFAYAKSGSNGTLKDITINTHTTASAGHAGALIGRIAKVDGNDAAYTVTLASNTYTGTTINENAIIESNVCGKKGTGSISGFVAP